MSRADRDTAGPLAGLTVVDLGHAAAGPWTTTFLGDLGADVIKIEHPRDGDTVRRFGALDETGTSAFWRTISRNKRCITLNLGTAEGQQVALDLLAQTDIAVENYRAGTLEKWNLGWDRLHERNPRLILLRTSGFGQTGPNSGFPGFGTLAEAMSGFASITGDADGPPQLPQFPLADGIASLVGTVGVLAALREREHSGLGQWIDNSLSEPLMRLMEFMFVEHSLDGRVRTRQGNRLPGTSPRGAYESAEPGRWVALSGSNDATALRILRAIERVDLAEDPELAHNPGRVERADEIDAALADWIGRHAQADVLAAFRSADAPIAPVYSVPEVLADEHFIDREVFVHRPSDCGELAVPNVIPRLSRTPGSVRFLGQAQGSANDDVLAGRLGYSEDRIAELRSKGVI